MYEVTPKSTAPTRRALFLHGGAYIHEIQPAMWSLVAKTAVATSTRFTVPIYPLAPLGVAEHVVPVATDLAAEIIADVGPDFTALMGDSAGGGMTLAVALQLRDRGLAAPYRTVLISPWLDITLTAPDIPALAAKDPELAPAGIVAAGVLYRGELPAEDPRVSPINGDLSGLGPITLFSGTHDILNSDAKRFVPLAKEAGVSIDYHEAPGMLHGRSHPGRPGRRTLTATGSRKLAAAEPADHGVGGRVHQLAGQARFWPGEVHHVVVGLLAGCGLGVDVRHVSGVHGVEGDGRAEEVLAERRERFVHAGRACRAVAAPAGR